MSMMDPLHLLCLLLCMTSSSSQASENPDEHNVVGDHALLKKPGLPVVLDRYTETLAPSAFRGRGGPQADPRHGPGPLLCGIECQRAFPPLDQAEQERILGYETLHRNGTRTRTRVSLRGFSHASSHRASRPPAPKRSRRQVFGPDGRFVISGSHFVTRYPFSSAARLSTGCSGVLVSPRHVLTSASCVHDGRGYLDGVPRLRVGLLQLKNKRGRGGGGGRKRGGNGGGGRRRGGGGRGGGGGQAETVEEEKGEEEEEEEGEEANSVDPVEPPGGVRGRGGRGRPLRRRGARARARARAEAEAPAGDERQAEEGAGGIDDGGYRRRRRRSTPRSAGAAKRPVFRWSRVKRTHVPAGWIQTDASNDDKSNNRSMAADYDYALLELKRPVKQTPMLLGVAPSDQPLARIHFSGYDLERAPSDGSERVVYRFCSVSQESDDLIYQHCDAQQGASGAGVYVRDRQEVDGKWRRRVIGVFSGHRWVELEGSRQKEFNVAVRITPAKYAQICHWIHGDPRRCEAV